MIRSFLLVLSLFCLSQINHWVHADDELEIQLRNPPVRIMVGDVLPAQLSQNLNYVPEDFPLDIKPLTNSQDEKKIEFSFEGPSIDSPDFKFVPLKSGTLQIPKLEIRSAQGKVLAVTQSLDLHVESAVDEKDPQKEIPAPLKPPVAVSFPLFWGVLIALVAMALLIGIYFAIRKWRHRDRKTGTQVEAILDLRSEDEIALTAIQELVKQKWMSQGAYKKHYFTLSEILKKYIGSRYRFDALESTSYEIMERLNERRSLATHHLETLSSIFNRLDRIKFTDAIPTLEEGQSVVEDVKEFVIQTKRAIAIQSEQRPGAHP